MLKYIYITLGMITLGLGLLGIVTPGLPTTPLIMLTAFFFAKSSPRLHQKLTEHRITGPYLKRIHNGLSVRARVISISIMWIMVCFSAFIIFSGIMRSVMIGLGIIGTIAQLIVFRKKKAKENTIQKVQDNGNNKNPHDIKSESTHSA